MNECEWSVGGKLKYWTGTCPCATLPTTKSTWIELGSNPVLRSKMPLTNRLSCGAAVGVLKTDLKKNY